MGLPERLGRAPQPARAEFVDWQSRMRTAFFEAVSEDDMREIVQGLVAKAKAGDLAAVRLLLAYGIGSPAVRVKNAVIVAGGEAAPLPAAPSRELPGSAGRILDMTRRARAGQGLSDPRDKARDLE